jgi:glycosyltransferase involved in cell wall biosynthesis
MNSNLVTVVLPTHNRPAFLREALTSVLAQDFEQFRVLVVDDASSYDVAELISSFPDPRVSLHRHQHNLGVVRNWHWCLCAPNTRYVAILEDDCLWLPHHLGAAVQALERHPRAPFYCCATEVFGAGESGIYKPSWATDDTIGVYDWHQSGFARQWLSETPLAASSVVLRRDAVSDLNWGGKTWPWCHDYLTWGQLALKGPLLYNPRIGARYRWHEANITSTFHKNAARIMAQWRYTLRYLATLAYSRGALRDLASETHDFTPASLSMLILALTAPETPKGLSQQAHTIHRARRDLALDPTSSRLYRLAVRIGDWALPYADVSARLLVRWWPIPAL